jgi:hypothetical protein
MRVSLVPFGDITPTHHERLERYTDRALHAIRFCDQYVEDNATLLRGSFEAWIIEIRFESYIGFFRPGLVLEEDVSVDRQHLRGRP